MEFFGRYWRATAFGFFGWTLFGVFFALQNYVNAIYFGQPPRFGATLAVWLICGYAWMFLTPLVVYLAEKFYIKSGQIGRNLTVHLLAGSVLSIFQLSIFIFGRQWFLADSNKTFSFSADFQRLFVAEFHVNLLIYWSVVGIAHLRLVNRRYLERERESARLALAAAQFETNLAEARLDALKMQLHPHFLFNTLNSISVLMRGGDAEAADRMLVRLSELLRAALRSGSAQEVSLKEELEFTRGYLEIEQIRFQDRLRVCFDVQPDALDALVPNLILQPLVENAVRHGIAPLAEAGKIIVKTEKQNGFVRLSVTDNGAGLSDSGGEASGIGLKNTRERLEKLYGENQRFEIASSEGGGLQVKIEIPFLTNADDE